MANTPNFALYKPSRADSGVEVDVSLTDNFVKIDTELKNNKDGLDTHKADVNAHASDKITHADGSVKTTLDNHEERLTSGEVAQADHETRISSNETTVADHETRLTGVEGKADDIDNRVTDIETLGLDILAPNLEGRLATVESDVEGFLAPATFDAMDSQSYTFDEYRIGYVEDKLVQVKNRIFKPTFSMSAYWGWTNDYNGSFNQKSRTNIQDQIDIWEKHHVDAVTLIIHIGYNSINNSLYIAENLEDLAWAVPIIEGKGMRVSAIKIHNNFSQTHITALGDANYRTLWKGFITQIGTRFQSFDIPILTVMNEFSNIYADSGHFSFVIECLNLAKGMGYKTGVSTAGAEESMNLDSSILSVVDYVFINTYPFITNKKDKATASDGVLGWQAQPTLYLMQSIKDTYPNLKFIISESGVQDYYVALTKPENYTWNSGDVVETGGKAQAIFMSGLLEYLNNDIISEVWWWFDLADNEPTKSLLRNYVGGISYEYAE